MRIVMSAIAWVVLACVLSLALIGHLLQCLAEVIGKFFNRCLEVVLFKEDKK